MDGSTNPAANPEWEANIYGQRQQVNRYPFDIVVSFIFRHFGRLHADERASVKILEVGCGTGNNVWFLAREGFDVTGIEGSPTAVKLGQELIANEGLKARIIAGDFSRLSWPDNTFDAVIDRCAVTHNRVEHIKRSFDEIKRVLKPGGVFQSQMFSTADTHRLDGRDLGDGAFTDFGEGPFENLGVAYFADRTALSHLLEDRFEVQSLEHNLMQDAASGDARAFWQAECSNTLPADGSNGRARGLIICGTYRSGTNLLQKLINAHPLCNVVMQPCLPFFKTLQRRQIEGDDQPMGIGGDDPAMRMDTEYFTGVFDADALTSLISDIENGLQEQREAGDDVPGPEFHDCLVRQMAPGNPVSVLSGIIDAVQAYRSGTNCRYAGFKEQYIDEFLEDIIRLSPRDYRILHLTRDPRAILASRNYGAYRQEGEAPTQHPLLMVVKMWRTSQRYKMHLQSACPESFLPLKYEDLILDRPTILAKAAEFLELEDHTMMLDETNLRLEDGNGWKPNTSFGPDHDPVKSREKWKELLPPETIGVMEFLCRNEMEAMGYACTVSEETQLAYLHSYREDENSLLPWTRMAGLLLDDKEKARQIERDAQIRSR
jgi:SAM-dependent methyltransferase